MRGLLLPLALGMAAPLAAQAIIPAVVADPAPDAQYPASMEQVLMPSHGALLNAVLYLASGKGPHPTMVLFHGFPGNEQNLDLAQAVRRAGWNVLTLHYRGSWGSPGAFSFAHCVEDADAAVAFLRAADSAARYRIDPARIVAAGHSMGGMMAARAAADNQAVIGAILIDAWDMAGEGRHMKADPAYRAQNRREEFDGDMPPLAGTTADALMAELETAAPAIDLIPTATAILPRPLLVLGAERAGAPTARAIASAVRNAGGKDLQLIVMPTDHPFSDHRIALADAVVRWLGRFAR
jgi:pimeloyl-ACP methyl ester carboxylesterase